MSKELTAEQLCTLVIARHRKGTLIGRTDNRVEHYRCSDNAFVTWPCAEYQLATVVQAEIRVRGEDIIKQLESAIAELGGME